MRKLPPLNFGDLVEVKEGFVKGRLQRQKTRHVQTRF